MNCMKRVIALVFVLTLTVAPVRAAGNGAAFTDVPKDHWAYDYIGAAVERGFINGQSASTFGLGKDVTRAEYAAMLCRLMGWAVVTPERGSYSDNQDKSAWYYSWIETARENGALLKLDDACKPNEALPREDMAAMTVRALGYATLSGIVQDDCPFTDVRINRGYIALIYHMGVMKGVSESKFSPRGATTREQAATVLLRVYDRLHADLTVVNDVDPALETAARVESITGAETPVPMSPRAPLEGVYDAALIAGKGGAVAMNVKPYAQLVSKGAVDRGFDLTDAELNTFLADTTADSSVSARYNSHYLVRSGKEGTKTVVWYETKEDVDKKIELCRLLGIETVYLVK